MPDREVLWSRTKDLLVVIVIPAAIWITSSIFDLREAIQASAQEAKLNTERSTETKSKTEKLTVKLIKLERVQKDIDYLSSTITTLSSKDNTLEVKVTRLESKIESMGDDIKDIKSMVKTLVKP